jgi:hypothetical protein
MMAPSEAVAIQTAQIASLTTRVAELERDKAELVGHGEVGRTAGSLSRSASFRLSVPSLPNLPGSSDTLALADWLLEAQTLTLAGILGVDEGLLYAASSLTDLAQQVWRKASTDFRSRNIPVTRSLDLKKL